MAALLEKLHPEPVPAFPLVDIDRELESFRDSIYVLFSHVEFYRRLAPLVTALGDDHVRLSLASVVRAIAESQPGWRRHMGRTCVLHRIHARGMCFRDEGV